MPSSLPPLLFRPLLKRYLWGGRRLGTVLGKPIGEGEDYAESWEVVDHDQGQSVVADGPLAGTTLGELVVTRGDEILGRHAEHVRALRSPSRFPLLFKYLDCQRDLSVQVHPDDAAAARLTPPDLGKTEAWVVLDAAAGSRICAGLKPGVTREQLTREVAAGRTEACLHSFEPRPGDCVFIPAGTVHALGGGLLVAEIQQASDTTWRLYDWGRLGPDGQPRPLHVEAALQAIDYEQQSLGPQTPQPTDRPQIERLVACDKFVLDRWQLDRAEPVGGDERFHILSVLDGAVLLETAAAGNSKPLVLARGQTVLLPASLGPAKLLPTKRSTLLDMYLP
jgi:mannose-6-phosphate isomerase